MTDVQNFTYHCHTNFSDGNNSIEEMVLRAKEIGFSHMGISDHLIVHKNLYQSPSYEGWKKYKTVDMYAQDFKKILAKYQKHCADIRQAAKKMNMNILVGFEVDFFTYDGWLEELKEFLSLLDYDYLISGNHMVFNEDCSTFFDFSDLARIASAKDEIHRYIERHFFAVKSAVQSGLFDFVAHLDYVKRYCSAIYDYCEYQPAICDLLDEMARCDVGTELSTKGLRKIGAYYPSAEIMEEVAQRNIKTVISDDAHDVIELGTFFADAEQVLLEHNISRRINFESVDKKQKLLQNK